MTTIVKLNVANFRVNRMHIFAQEFDGVNMIFFEG